MTEIPLIGAHTHFRLPRVLDLLINQYFPFYMGYVHEDRKGNVRLQHNIQDGMVLWEKELVRPWPTESLAPLLQGEFGPGQTVYEVYDNHNAGHRSFHCGSTPSGRETCGCSDFKQTGKRCRHLFAAHMFVTAGPFRQFTEEAAFIQAHLGATRKSLTASDRPPRATKKEKDSSDDHVNDLEDFEMAFGMAFDAIGDIPWAENIILCTEKNTPTSMSQREHFPIMRRNQSPRVYANPARSGDRKWSFGVKYGLHSHPAEPPETCNPLRKPTPEQITFIHEQLNLFHKAAEIKEALNARYPGNCIQKRHIYYQRTIIRASQRPANKAAAALEARLATTTIPYHVFTDSDNHVSSFLIVDPQSLSLHKRYPTVIMMDCTYRPNKHRHPVLHVIGCCGTNDTFSIAIASWRKKRKRST